VSGLCGEISPLKKKTPGVRAVDVGTLTTLGTCACTYWRKMMVINLDRLVPYEGTAWDERPEGGSSRSGWRIISVKTKPHDGMRDQSPMSPTQLSKRKEQ
jgi:hypothetical protein